MPIDAYISTENVPPDNRAQYWAEEFVKIWADIEIIPTAGKVLAGRAVSRSCGALQYNHLFFQGHSIRRTSSHLRSIKTPYYSLTFPQAGQYDLCISGKRHSLLPGCAHLISNVVPAECLDITAYQTLNVLIPAALINERISNPQPFYSLSLTDGAKSKRAQLLKHLVCGYFERLPFDEEDDNFANKQLLDFVEFSFFDGGQGNTSDESSVQTAHYRRVTQYIDQHIELEECTPDVIARDCGISVSYLYRIFQSMDTTVMEHVRETRLMRARKMLNNPQMGSLSISEIAYRNGFSSLSSFSRAFRSRFSVSPKEIRNSSSVLHDR